MGVYFENCTICKTYWKLVQPFKHCYKCQDIFCNICIRKHNEVVFCAMCKKKGCLQCTQFDYIKCAGCNNIHRHYTHFCKNCWGIVIERKDYKCGGCGGNSINEQMHYK